ncbi:MAG: GPW/gp25 family protein [Synechococcales bacterium]|nr:GPW/gp25 family protein [Synechococcales bacterium]
MPTGMNEVPNPVIGAGFAFPASVNVQGSIQLSANSPNLEESIRIILGTKLGERVYRPNFGSRLSELVFEPMNSSTMTLIRLYVEEALEMWEPRILLRQIITEPDGAGQSGRVDIHILYSPKDEPDTRSMVYPFYLQQAEPS